MAERKLISVDAVHMKKSAVEKMIVLVLWYKAMPDWIADVAGGRFHENVNEVMQDYTPEGFDALTGDDNFFQRFDVVNGELKIIISDHRAVDEQTLDVIVVDD